MACYDALPDLKQKAARWRLKIGAFRQKKPPCGGRKLSFVAILLQMFPHILKIGVDESHSRATLELALEAFQTPFGLLGP